MAEESLTSTSHGRAPTENFLTAVHHRMTSAASAGLDSVTHFYGHHDRFLQASASTWTKDLEATFAWSRRNATTARTSWSGNTTNIGYDTEDFLRQKNDEFTMLVIPAIVFLAILFVVGVIGNSLVLYVYNRKLHKGTIRWFIQALAIFDLLSCLVAIPGETIDMRNNYTFGSSPMCKILRAVNMFCTVGSGMTLMVVAVERYKRICTPLRKQISPRQARIIIVVCTLAALVCASPAAIIYGKQTVLTDNPAINGSDCSTADLFLGTVYPMAFSSFQFVLFLAGATGLVALYVLIGRKIWSHERFRRIGFNTGINRRISFIFTGGSECSSPTTDDVVFTFPYRRNAGEEASSNSNSNSNNNNDDEEGPAAPEFQGAKIPSAKSEPFIAGGRGLEEGEASTLPFARSRGDAPMVASLDPSQITSGPKSPASSSITTSSLATIPLTFRSSSSSNQRERAKSAGESTLKGRYRRRSTVHTQADIRRFLNRSDSVNSGTRRTTLMLFLITVVFLLSFLPYLVLNVLKVLDDDSLSGDGNAWEVAHNVLLRSYFINSVANPVIYSFCSRTFRTECSRVLHCGCCRK